MAYKEKLNQKCAFLMHEMGVLSGDNSFSCFSKLSGSG
jgi:hypothetical protein